MSFRLTFTPEAAAVLKHLEESADPKLKKVRKALGLLETNPRHPGLETHHFESLRGPGGEKVFEAYVENRTPRAWRIFWYYGPQPGMIRILNITPHP
jgi:hypothetical protein